MSKTLIDRLGARLKLSSGSNRTLTLLGDFLTGSATSITAVDGNDLLSLDAERRRGLIKILAEPTIMALSGEQGEFLAGGKLFIPVAQSLAGGASLLRVSIRRIGADRVDRPEFVEVLDDLTAMQRARESQRDLESQVEQGAHAAAVMTVLLALAREERLQTTSLERLLETLPGAFRAPSLLRVHLRSPWLTRGREATASGAAVLRWPLDFGAAGQGVLEVHYEDQPGAGGRAFDAAERKLLDETARTLEALGRRTAACTMATGHDQQAGLAGEKTT